jgi:dTMP kinase
MTKRGKFVAFDGLDGSGKDTQLRLLKEKLSPDSNFFTYEPGGTDFADLIRALIFRAESESTPTCDFFLFWASRAAHLEDTVEPALEKGFNVLTNRYASSTWAFQICGEQQRQLEPLFRTIHSMLPGMLAPDAYFIFDLPAEVAFERTKARAEQALAQEQTRFDVKPLEYHRRVRDGFREFKAFACETGSQYFVIDANRDEQSIHKDLWQLVQNVLQS